MLRVLCIILMALSFLSPQAYAQGNRTMIVKENGSAGKRFLVIYDNVNSQHSDSLSNLTSPTRNTKNIAATFDCEDAYFAPDDHNHEHPLQKPHPEFVKSYKQAKAGDAMEQRNVAVSYDAGYLVNRCFDKAYDWYSRAAKGGDKISIEWITRNNNLLRLRAGPEFFGVLKFPENLNPWKTISFKGSNFPVNLTINGKTVDGVWDTGATHVSLNESARDMFGLGFAFSHGEDTKSTTANGVINNKTIIVPTLSVEGVQADNVIVSCCVTSNVLVGLSFINRVESSSKDGVLKFRKNLY